MSRTIYGTIKIDVYADEDKINQDEAELYDKFDKVVELLIAFLSTTHQDVFTFDTKDAE